MKHKRYLVFTYPVYYPFGGLSDLVGSFDTVEECKELIRAEGSTYNEIYNEIYDRIEGIKIAIY
jgi:hypothetical protein